MIPQNLAGPSGNDDSGGGGTEEEVTEQHRVLSKGAGGSV